MKKVIVIIIFFLSISCNIQKKNDKQAVDIELDSVFRKKVNEQVFAYEVDSPDTLYSKYLRINYKKKKIEILIDTLSSQNKLFLESMLNNLVFNKDSLAINYFKNKSNRLNHFILDELSKNIPSNDILELCYANSVDSFNVVVKKFIFINNDNNKSEAKYILGEPELFEIFSYKKEWVLSYFPRVLKEYDLNLGQKSLLMCYMYKCGDKQPLIDLFNDNGLAFEEKEIVKQNILNLNITLKDSLNE